MRRTTICRSSRVVVLALAAVTLTWGYLPAQDTTQVPQDTTLLQDTTQVVAALQGQLPASHTVIRGETLGPSRRCTSVIRCCGRRSTASIPALSKILTGSIR